ncbi:MAG: hypothetical protein HC880_04920 [Bacteroidia bacterium]|nr:hypothetical protein [Bacteroidia bacterium]
MKTSTSGRKISMSRLGRISVLLVGTLFTILLIYSYFSYQRIQHSEAYQVARQFLEKSERLHQLSGGIKHFGLPSGRQDAEGLAHFQVRIQGMQRDVRAEVSLLRDSTGSWRVVDHALH